MVLDLAPEDFFPALPVSFLGFFERDAAFSTDFSDLDDAGLFLDFSGLGLLSLLGLLEPRRELMDGVLDFVGLAVGDLFFVFFGLRDCGLDPLFDFTGLRDLLMLLEEDLGSMVFSGLEDLLKGELSLSGLLDFAAGLFDREGVLDSLDFSGLGDLLEGDLSLLRLLGFAAGLLDREEEDEDEEEGEEDGTYLSDFLLRLLRDLPLAFSTLSAFSL